MAEGLPLQRQPTCSYRLLRSERRRRPGISREFAARGCDVALIARNVARLETAAAELRERGVRVLPLVADVADAEKVEAAAERAEQELGPIHSVGLNIVGEVMPDENNCVTLANETDDWASRSRG